MRLAIHGQTRTYACQKQHTINVILQTNLNAKFLEERDAITPHIRSGKFPDTVLNDKNQKLRNSFRAILNHYEFIAAGLRNGDFDEKLVRDSEGSTYIYLYKYCEPYIWKLRDSRKRMTIYEHLEWLTKRWDSGKPPLWQRLIERMTQRPFYGASGKST